MSDTMPTDPGGEQASTEPVAADSPEELLPTLLRAIESVREAESPAAISSQLSLLLRPLSGEPLVQRILFHLALADRGAGRARFVVDVLLLEGAPWLARTLAAHAQPSAEKTWQKRRLRNLLAEEHEMDVQTGERLAASVTLGRDGVTAARAGDEELRAAPGSTLEKEQWFGLLVDALRTEGPGMHRDVLLVTLSPEADDAAITALLTACRVLPVTTALRCADAEQVLRVEQIGRSIRLTAPSVLAVQADEPVAEAPDAPEEHAAGEMTLVGIGGRALQELLAEGESRIADRAELAALAAAVGAVELLTDPILREHRSLVAEALRQEHRALLPMSTDRRTLTRVLRFHASGREAATLRESLAGHALSAGFAAEALALLRDVPRTVRGTYHAAREARALYALARFEELAEHRGATGEHAAEARAATEMLSMLDQVSAQPAESIDPRPGTALTILHASAPAQSGGYAVRAHSLLRSLSSAVDSLVAYTRPGFPEAGNRLAPGQTAPAEHDGVRYHRIGTERARDDGEYRYMLESVEHYREVIRRERPAVVHLRSTYVTALPGLIAAKHFGLPVIYEVSGMWELVYEAANTARLESRRARTVRLEDAVLSGADTVVTITEAMAEIISSRTTTAAPVQLVPNAVDVDEFAAAGRDEALLEQLGWTDGAPVIGYIGTFVGYEGLDLTLRALAQLRDRGVAFHALLVGDGAEAPALRSLAAELELGPEHLVFTGRIPHEQVARHTAVIDVFAFPRRRTPATVAVSPLKPFEAMAAGKAVIVSDVPALAEIVGHGERGLIVPAGSAPALADALAEVLADLDATRGARESARTWVREQRSWDAVGTAFAGHVQHLMP